MKIDVGALGLVAAVSLVATVFVVGVTAVGIRAYDTAAEHTKSGRPAGGQVALARLCIGVAGLAVIFGIWLIVPAFH